MRSDLKNSFIKVKGANEHNLKNVSVDIPKNSLIVITGLSGSGKSSLAFDTIYAEGQRRFLEGLSSFSRQYMVQFKKPDVESIQGLTPAIAIEQKTTNTSPRSTVGTITGVYDYLRLLYSKIGQPRCPDHNLDVKSSDVETVLGQLLSRHLGQKIQILAPVANEKKGEFQKEIAYWQSKGFIRAFIDGAWVELSEINKLAKTKPHNIDVLVDQLPVEEKFSHRIKSSLNRAFDIASGLASIIYLDTQEKDLFSLDSSCPTCGYSFPELDPNHFSFNNPRGACEECKGLGTTDIQEESVFVDGQDGQKSQVTRFKYVAESHSDEEDEVPTHLVPCDECDGTRLNKKARSVFVNEKNIAELSNVSMTKLKSFLSDLKLTGRDQTVGEKIVQQILSRLQYLENIGAGYLSLSRTSATLSGGESQRIRLATQLGASMVGVLYVLDEPSIGLHPRDHHKLLRHLNEIKDRGNTIIVVEHDEETMENADFIVDIGPRAGEYGGEIKAVGNLESIKNNPESLTGLYLSHKKKIPYPDVRRGLTTRGNLSIKKASGHNLKNVSVDFPLGQLIGVAGISGSGKSTLIIDTLYPALSEKVYGFKKYTENFESISGYQSVDKVIQINQNPIGRTPRSTPATYVGLFPLIRDLFARLPDSKIRGFKPGHFSFNVKGGRCETCKGHGQVKIEMHFLTDVYVPCEECRGRRYNSSVLTIKFKDQSIGDILEMSVSDAKEFFRHQTQIYEKLKTLDEVGLGYLRLGQSSLTLSGGEAQRVKLSRELSKRSTGRTFYILDEPTTGLHFEDIKKLIELLHRLVDQGNTVLVIEHNIDVLKNCDTIVELGPEGGEQGGELIFTGTPEQLALSTKSFTAPFVKKTLSLKKSLS